MLPQLFQREKRVYQKSLPTLRAMKSPHRTAEHMKWSDQQLGSVFDDICQGQRDESAPLRLLMFLDAVDESLDREMEAVVSSLRRLLSTARKHSVFLGICITSRPLPELRREADLACGCISLQKENHDAIYTYIESELASRRDDRRGEDYYSRFAEKVAERADGVFLWVALVVPRLRRKIDNGGTIRELEALLQDIPNNLKKLFIDILQRIPGPDLGITMRTLQIATLVRRRLTLEEFQHALAFQPGSPYKSLEAWKRSSDFLELGKMLIARLQYYSGGLLELREELDVEIDPVTQYQEFLQNFPPQPLSPDPTRLRQETTKLRAEENIPSDIYPKLFPEMLRKFTPGKSKADTEIYVSATPPRKTVRRRVKFKSKPSPIFNIPSAPPGGHRPIPDLCQFLSKPIHHVPVVRFIHETAKHFFRENEGFHILYDLILASEAAKATPNPFCSPSGCYLTGGHQFIVNSCASYLSIQELRPDVTKILTSSTRPLVDEFHLLQYIIESWFHHIHAAEEGGLAQTHILRWLLYVQPSALNQCICWAGEHDLRSWIRWCIENKVDVNVVDATLLSYGRPIRSAVANGFYEAARLLIQAGANVNGITGGLETTLRVAERMRNQEIIELLRENEGVLRQPHWLPPEGQIVKL
ncbi:hypothetical protein J4E90_005364 [Alternaria incomplexa]|uniref:uncharacterized protein n=1 Tax=Alternaria incomplexa TaxID=1187928 RepID=UPI00221FDF00|nr:uncharacterized protein J4E90_005364 [Alternaria incomplexa]KAI4913645.1 hypothetical protein J4E90_005364 [Alternaria incomplexa]